MTTALSNSRCRSIVRSLMPSDATLDSVRDRFGSAAITRAVLPGRYQGPSVLIARLALLEDPGGGRDEPVLLATCRFRSHRAGLDSPGGRLPRLR